MLPVQITSCRYISFDLASSWLKYKGQIKKFTNHSVSSQHVAVSGLPRATENRWKLSLYNIKVTQPESQCLQKYIQTDTYIHPSYHTMLHCFYAHVSGAATSPFPSQTCARVSVSLSCAMPARSRRSPSVCGRRSGSRGPCRWSGRRPTSVAAGRSACLTRRRRSCHREEVRRRWRGGVLSVETCGKEITKVVIKLILVMCEADSCLY